MSKIDAAVETTVSGGVDMSAWNVAVEGWWYQVIANISVNIAYRRGQGWGVELVQGDRTVKQSSFFGESFTEAVKAAEEAYKRIAAEQKIAEGTTAPEAVVTLSASILAEIIDLAKSHVEDIKEGLEDHTYERGENLSLPVRLNAIDTAEKLHRQSTLKRS